MVLRLLDLPQARVQIDVQILLPALSVLGLVRAAPRSGRAASRMSCFSASSSCARSTARSRAGGFDLRQTLVDRFRLALVEGFWILDLLSQCADLLARFVVVEQGRVAAPVGKQQPKAAQGGWAISARISTHRCRACRRGGSATSSASLWSVQRGFSSPRLTGFDLRVGRAHQHQHALDAFGAPLAQGDVVFAAAALVAVALDEHLRAAVLRRGTCRAPAAPGGIRP